MCLNSSESEQVEFCVRSRSLYMILHWFFLIKLILWKRFFLRWHQMKRRRSVLYYLSESLLCSHTVGSPAQDLLWLRGEYFPPPPLDRILNSEVSTEEFSSPGLILSHYLSCLTPAPVQPVRPRWLTAAGFWSGRFVFFLLWDVLLDPDTVSDSSTLWETSWPLDNLRAHGSIRDTDRTQHASLLLKSPAFFFFLPDAEMSVSKKEKFLYEAASDMQNKTWNLCCYLWGNVKTVKREIMLSELLLCNRAAQHNVFIISIHS